MKIDQILTLIDEFEEAVERRSDQISCGYVDSEIKQAEKAYIEAKARLIEALKKALK